MPLDRKRYLISILSTLALMLLIGVGAATAVTQFIYFMLPAVAVTVSFFVFLFPGSRLFSLALANCLALYTCLFVFLAELNFAGQVSLWEACVAYALPLVGFVSGSWRKRETIRRLVTTQEAPEDHHEYGRFLLWIAPLVVLVFLVTGIRHTVMPVRYFDDVFLGAMALMAAVVFLLSHDISVFLLRTGLAFEGLFQRLRSLLAPIYAFTTFYTLCVIFFACIYRIVDLVSDDHQFIIRGELGEISFIESLYFSIITLSTVGYGDIVPATAGIQAIVAIQIIAGVLLLLFGFNEIFGYARSRKQGPDA